MITVADIKAALAAILESVPNVEAVNQYGYFSDLINHNIVATMPPFRLESRYGFTESADSEPAWQSHRFAVEFWVRDNGDPKAIDTSMNALNHDAIAALLANQVFTVAEGQQMRLGFYDGRFDFTLTFEVADFFTRPERGGPTFLVAALVVPVTDVI